MAKKAGRIAYSVAIAADVCKLVSDGKTLKEISELANMPGRATIYQWFAAHKEFADMYARAREERADLIALVYIGRGDMEAEEWGAAVRLAREREAAGSLSTADWLLGIPNLGDLWDEGLAAMGRSCG